jgi:hypothetical protein
LRPGHMLSQHLRYGTRSIVFFFFLIF